MLRAFFHLPLSKAWLWVSIVIALVVYASSLAATTIAKPLLQVGLNSQADRPSSAALSGTLNHFV